MIKLIVLDVDGTLTDGRLYMDDKDNCLKIQSRMRGKKKEIIQLGLIFYLFLFLLKERKIERALWQ